MTALVPVDPVKAQVLASIYSLKSYTYAEYHELLASGEIDAVYVATPNFLHAQYVLPALSAGIHVLLEKPMATTEAECRDMADAAERTGAKLMVAYRLHCEPGTLDMIERVQKGEFGDPRVFTSTFAQVVKASNHRKQNGFAAGPVADMGPSP
jgi:predicted dehydrogenase